MVCLAMVPTPHQSGILVWGSILKGKGAVLMNDQNQVLQKLPINQLILLARDFIRNDHGAHGDYFCALLAKRWLDDPEVVLKENPHADLRVL
ncbi:MAG: hypothetical protein AAGA35_00570, partial [Patescibacteria group bacterium]